MANQSSKQSNLPANQPPKEKSPQAVAGLKIERYESGPLPSPIILGQYEKILPGAADRIVGIFEEQARHRMSLEKIVVGGDDRRSNRGLYCALTVALVTILVAGLSYTSVTI
jgi:uncharacterized membrane protein